VEPLWLLGRGEVKNFAFESTAYIALLKGTPNAIKSVWEGSHFATYCKMGPEPKEGGTVNSQKIVQGKHKTRIKKPEVRMGNHRVSYILFSVCCFLWSLRVENTRGFGVWPKHALNWLNGYWLNS
jgi:hypothetical protein